MALLLKLHFKWLNWQKTVSVQTWCQMAGRSSLRSPGFAALQGFCLSEGPNHDCLFTLSVIMSFAPELRSCCYQVNWPWRERKASFLWMPTVNLYLWDYLREALIHLSKPAPRMPRGCSEPTSTRLSRTPEPRSFLTILGSLWESKSASNTRVRNEDGADYPKSLWNLDCVFSKDERLVKKKLLASYLKFSKLRHSLIYPTNMNAHELDTTQEMAWIQQPERTQPCSHELTLLWIIG